MKKRALLFAWALIMRLPLFPAAAFAAVFTDASKTYYAYEAIMIP